MKNNHLQANLARAAIAANIELAYLKQLTIPTYVTTLDAIGAHLAADNIFFEGKTVPVSLNPTVTTIEENRLIAKDFQVIRHILLKVIDKFISDFNNNATQSPVVNYFAPYQQWFHLIAAEKRQLPTINLMRYDTVFDKDIGWQIMETNTCCPGGVINNAKIKEAWVKTTLAQTLCADYKVSNLTIDSATGFLQFLIKQARIISNQDTANIAICSYKNVYTNELQALKDEFEKLKMTGKISNSELIICDARDIHEKNNSIYAKDLPVSLIYNKLDPLMIDPNEPTLNGWFAASRSHACDFLNSYAAMYLTEAKRILSLLHDESLCNYLKLSPLEREIIDTYIPNTFLLDDKNIKQVTDDRHQYVLKADALTRGAGIYIGKICTFDEWKHGIVETLTAHGVVQQALNAATKISLKPNDSTPQFTLSKEYYGLEWYMFGEDYAGSASRASPSPIFNIGHGGSVSPVLAIG